MRSVEVQAGTRFQSGAEIARKCFHRTWEKLRFGQVHLWPWPVSGWRDHSASAMVLLRILRRRIAARRPFSDAIADRAAVAGPFSLRRRGPLPRSDPDRHEETGTPPSCCKREQFSWAERTRCTNIFPKVDVVTLRSANASLATSRPSLARRETFMVEDLAQ